MRLRFSKAASEDLNSIYLESEEMFGRKQADTYAVGLAAVFRLIADYPMSSRLRHELRRPVRARPWRSHVVLYAVDEAGVLVLRVRHGHEDWQSDLPTPSQNNRDDQ